MGTPASEDTGLTDLSGGSWLDAFKRTVKAFKPISCPIWAAALTYFGILSIFPALLVVVSILGLIGRSATDSCSRTSRTWRPGPRRRSSPTRSATSRAPAARRGSPSSSVSRAAVWAASGYVNGFMSASNAIYDVEEGRSMAKTLPVRVGLTLVLMVLAVVIAFAVTMTGGIAREVGERLGVGDARWRSGASPSGRCSCCWSACCSRCSTGARRTSSCASASSRPARSWPCWAGCSRRAGFAFYVANFSSYSKIYGALAGPIVFLLWLWISNICILLGAELNAELERSRKLESGEVSREDEQFVELRDTDKLDDDA